MIVIQIIFLILLSIGSVVSIAGLGSLLNFQKKSEFIINFFLGYLILATLVTLIHFFFRINFIVVTIIFLTGLVFSLNLYGSKLIKLAEKHYLFFFVFIALIPIFISQKYHEDFGYYHLPHIINLVNEKIIFGLGNVNYGFVHNSIWLNILPVFYVGESYDFVTLPTFLLYTTFIIFSFNKIIKQKKNLISNYLLIVCLFYLILKFTRISEFGNDLPALIFSILALYFFFKFEEENKLNEKKSYFFYHLAFTLFALLIKFSVIPIVLLTFYVFLNNFKILYKEIFKFNYVIIYFLIFIYFVQQFIYTGCFVFPTKISCLNVMWFNEDFLNLKTDLELVNKSYSEAKNTIAKEEYLKNFLWLPFWFNRNYPEILENILTMAAPVILFMFFLKKTSKKIENVKLGYAFKIFVLTGFIYWLSFSPVYRFGIIYFVSLILITSVFLGKNKIFSKKVFLIFIIFFISFNFVKNINRILVKNEIFVGIQKINNEYKYYDSKLSSHLTVVQPDISANAIKGNGWQGRLCWDIMFLCSYKEVKTSLINNYIVITGLK
jgi:hypothetical protein